MPSTAGHQYYEIEGIPGYWNKSGGDVEKATSDVAYPGPQRRIEKMAGIATTGNLTLTRPFDAATDHDAWRDAVINRLQSKDWRTTVTGHWVDPEVGPIGTPDTYANALLVGAPGMDADAAATDPVSFTLVFAPSRLS